MADLERLDALWQDGTDAVAIFLPPGLTALTALMLAELEAPPYVMKAPLPQLTELSALRRLDLRFKLRGPHAGCGVLPALPTGLTHLTIGVRQLKGNRDHAAVKPHLLQQARNTTCRVYAFAVQRTAAAVMAHGRSMTQMTQITPVYP